MNLSNQEKPQQKDNVLGAWALIVALIVVFGLAKLFLS